MEAAWDSGHELAARVREELALFHNGAGEGITCNGLALALDAKPRAVRKAVSLLRMAGVPVCGNPASGYFYARTPEEVEETCLFLRGRALHSLKLEARLRKLSLPGLVGQVRAELEQNPLEKTHEGLDRH